MPEMRHFASYVTQVVEEVSRERVSGLQKESRRPKTSPNRKIFPEHEGLIAELRKRKLGHRRIQNELLRLHKL
jgi:hypothetical protein